MMIPLRRFRLRQLLLVVGLLCLLFGVIAAINRRFGISFHNSALAISPDGKTLAMGISSLPVTHRAQNVFLVDMDTWNRTALLVKALWVHDVAFSPDGRLLASCHSDGTIRLWDVATRREVKKIVAAQGEVICLAFSPDGLKLVTGGDDATLKIWDVTTGDELARLSGHTGRIMDVAYSHDGATMASASRDRTTRLWNTATTQTVATLNTDGMVEEVTFSRSGRLAMAGNEPKTAELREPLMGQVTDKFLIEQGEFTNSIAVSHDGKTLAAGHKGRITLWDTPSHRHLMTLEGHEDQWVDSVVFSPNGRTLISGSADGLVVAWDLSRRCQANVVATNQRQFPWALMLGGVICWSTAWYFANRKSSA